MTLQLLSACCGADILVGTGVSHAQRRRGYVVAWGTCPACRKIVQWEASRA